MRFALTFKSKHMLKSFFKYSTNSKISKYTINILKNIYDQIQNSEQLIDNIDIKSSAEILNYVVKPANFSYMEKSIQNNIITRLKITVVYTFRIYDKYVKINFILDKLDLEYTYKCVYKMLLWLFIVSKYSSSRSNNINIYLYMTSLEKMLPNNNDNITKYNINSGYTSFKDSSIVIFRKEEWFKVFIHETIHFFELDFRHDNYIRDKILQLFKVKSKVNLYEAYTETWAKIINIIFCSYFSSKDFNIFINIFDTLISIEKTFVVIQMTKILNFMDIDYIDVINGHDLYYEKTHILSYFIITAILLTNYQQFIKFCNENNENIFNFKDTKTNKDNFVKLIKKYYKSNKLFDTIEYINDIYVKDPIL